LPSTTNPNVQRKIMFPIRWNRPLCMKRFVIHWTGCRPSPRDRVQSTYSPAGNRINDSTFKTIKVIVMMGR
jgi:hypothetical protein